MDRDAHIAGHLAVAGCNCAPELTYWTDEHGIDRCTIAHDSWCKLLRKINASDS